MSKSVSISRLREARNVAAVDKIITNTPSTGEDDSGGSVTWVPEEDAADYIDADTLDVSENGTYTPEDGNYYNVVKVEVEGGASSGDSAELIDEKTIKANGIYYAIDDAQDADSKTAAYEQVNVEVPLAAKVITANGYYDATDDTSAEGDPVQGFSSVEVKVPGLGESDGRKIKKTIKSNGQYRAADEIVGEDEDPIQAYSEVDVAVPLITKKVQGNGTFNASDEQDSNGDTAVAYSEVEVGVDILQPALNATIGMDRKKHSLTLPFSVSIKDTSESDYGDYEKQHKPTVNFRNANIYIFESGGGLSPFRVSNFNFGSGFCHSWPRTITVNGQEKKIKNNSDAWNYTRLNNWATDTVKQSGNIIKYIKHGQFTGSGSGFVISGEYSGYMSWIVQNVSYSKDQYYSFTITVSLG